MTIEEAAAILRDMYNTAPSRDKAVNIHLFGIMYSAELDSLPISEVVRSAGLPDSYGTEVRKGRKLAEYVTLKH